MELNDQRCEGLAHLSLFLCPVMMEQEITEECDLTGDELRDERRMQTFVQYMQQRRIYKEPERPDDTEPDE